MSMSNTFQFSIHIRVTYKQFYLQKKANKKKKNQTPYNMIYPVVAHVPSKKKKKKKVVNPCTKEIVIKLALGT